ncbi:Fucose permease [Olsenella sp. KH3B4]|uniref:MFS transporter n=1 Tax=Olsenella sp. KH3B4 TaxID=1855394 RepID=UPI0008D2678E|nr:MFS transporter [Olsenella sp. KH3B4]SES64224.1 Fucose permease [Olsenella sp. KH3B4]
MTTVLLGIIYLAFVSLGLPDGLLGAAWPTMHASIGANVSLAGVISMIICLGTIVSSLLTVQLVRRLGTGKLTALSVALTAVALFGFSASAEFWQLALWAIPYGLGAGAVDASLNAYVATHYAARHMNWLHCCWGLGAAGGPMIMSWQMGSSAGWPGGYRIVGALQVALVVAITLSIPLWRDQNDATDQDGKHTVPTRRKLLALPGVKLAMAGFLCYCALESACGLWASTFLVLGHGVSAQAAALLASLFYAGITVGRFLSGVLTLRLDGKQLLRLGETIMGIGLVVLMVSPSETGLGLGLALLGLGCAPIYPQMIQLTPVRFGSQNAQSLMGLQMACAYVGSMAFPPLMGVIVERVSPVLLPVVAAGLLALMTVCLTCCDRRVEAATSGAAHQ